MPAAQSCGAFSPIARISAVALALMAASLIATSSGCAKSGGAAPAATSEAEKPATKNVRVITAQLDSWPVAVRVQGSLLADEDAVIGTKLAGRVESVEVDLGSVVKRGEPLVQLDRAELEMRVKQAEAQLEQTCAAIGKTPADDETTLVLENAPPVMLEQALVDEAKAAVARAERLLPSNAITDAEYETYLAQRKTAEARYASAINAVREQISLIGVRRAELGLARQQLADTSVVAPFDALVADRSVSPGAYVQVGQAVIALVRIDRLRFTAGVPESHASRLKIGQPIEIRIAGIEAPIVAAISRVSPMVVQSSRSVRIEADVPNADLALQAGLFAEAEITVDASATALAVPLSAVTQFAGVQKVWVVADGKSKQATVHTGRRDERRLEIRDGIPAGTVIIENAAEGHEGPVAILADPEST